MEKCLKFTWIIFVKCRQFIKTSYKNKENRNYPFNSYKKIIDKKLITDTSICYVLKHIKVVILYYNLYISKYIYLFNYFIKMYSFFLYLVQE